MIVEWCEYCRAYVDHGAGGHPKLSPPIYSEPEVLYITKPELDRLRAEKAELEAHIAHIQTEIIPGLVGQRQYEEKRAETAEAQVAALAKAGHALLVKTVFQKEIEQERAALLLTLNNLPAAAERMVAEKEMLAAMQKAGATSRAGGSVAFVFANMVDASDFHLKVANYSLSLRGEDHA